MPPTRGLARGFADAAQIREPFRFSARIATPSHRRAALAALLSITILAQAAAAMPDLKIVVKTTVPNRPALDTETTTYIQNDRKRVEERRQSAQLLGDGGPVIYLPAPPIATITRCDLKQVFTLNPNDREYTSAPLPQLASPEALQARAAQRPKPPAQQLQSGVPPQPTLLVEITTSDTGERKQMFGFPARHVVTTEKQIALGPSGRGPQANVTDGWYIDIDAALPCDSTIRGGVAILTGGTRKPGEPPQIPVLSVTRVGKPETGFAVATKKFFRSTVSTPDQALQTTVLFTGEMEVTELSTSPIDASLFEVPNNFRQVQQIRRTPAMPAWRRWLGWCNYYWGRMTNSGPG